MLCTVSFLKTLLPFSNELLDHRSLAEERGVSILRSAVCRGPFRHALPAAGAAVDTGGPGRNVPLTNYLISFPSTHSSAEASQL